MQMIVHKELPQHKQKRIFTFVYDYIERNKRSSNKEVFQQTISLCLRFVFCRFVDIAIMIKILWNCLIKQYVLICMVISVFKIFDDIRTPLVTAKNNISKDLRVGAF